MLSQRSVLCPGTTNTKDLLLEWLFCMTMPWNGLCGLCVLLCFEEQRPKLIFKVPSARPSGCFYCVAVEEWLGNQIHLLALTLPCSISSSFLPRILKQGLL